MDGWWRQANQLKPKNVSHQELCCTSKSTMDKIKCCSSALQLHFQPELHCVLGKWALPSYYKKHKINYINISKTYIPGNIRDVWKSSCFIICFICFLKILCILACWKKVKLQSWSQLYCLFMSPWILYLSGTWGPVSNIPLLLWRARRRIIPQMADQFFSFD